MEWRYRKELSDAPLTVSSLDNGGDRKRGANIAVRLDRLGVSPREETTEFDSVNHPIVAGLRDQRSPSSPRGVACSLCPPVAYFAILRITRCKRGGARVKEYRCRPTSGPNAVTERAWRPLFQPRFVSVYCSYAVYCSVLLETLSLLLRGQSLKVRLCR